MYVIRLLWLWALLLAAVCVAGCARPRPTTPHASSTLPPHRVPARVLYRGLVSGMSPREVWNVVCQRWAMGRCEKLRPVGLRHELGLTGMKSYLPDLKIYAYEGQHELRCQHYFYFRYWGLMAVRVECKADIFPQLRAVVQRYQRWYDATPAVNPLGTTQIYRWAKGDSGWRVDLLVYRKRYTALHLDLRRRWYDIATSLEPSVEHSDSSSIKVWKKVPVAVKREVLVNMGRLIDRLKSMHLKSQYYSLQLAPWSPPQTTEDCKPLPVGNSWDAETWKHIGFRPESATRLRYRLIHNYHYRRVGRTRVHRNYRIEAQGCGFTFQVSLHKAGIEWTYDPIIVREQLASTP